MAGPFVLEGAVSGSASELARRLAREAEAVCRHYLSNGRRQGAYWLVGDVRNTPGRSMFVRLKETAKGSGRQMGRCGHVEHGDLLDVIRESRGLADFKDVAEEARSFLSLPRSERRSRQRRVLVAEIRRSDEIIRGGAPPVRHVAADRAHSRRSVSAPTRHHGFARNRQSALPPALLLPARRA